VNQQESVNQIVAAFSFSKKKVEPLKSKLTGSKYQNPGNADTIKKKKKMSTTERRRRKFIYQNQQDTGPWCGTSNIYREFSCYENFKHLRVPNASEICDAKQHTQTSS
jgi:hypothetical protein